jgi:hypothetical protein
VGFSRTAAAEIRGKYAEMLAMRLEHAQGTEDATRVRSRMSALAERFPGALREIDRLELVEIQRRVTRLDAYLAASCEEEPWMVAVALFHDLARGALGAKRWLGKRREVDEAVVDAFEREAPSLPFPEEVRSWKLDLATIASPPRGRVMELVFTRLARELGTTVRAARHRVFGLPSAD